METIKNPHGISINKCCLSCQFMGYRSTSKGHNGVERICNIHPRQRSVKDGLVPCECWLLKKKYQEFGRTQWGEVHDPRYLHYLADEAGKVAEANKKINEANKKRPDGEPTQPLLAFDLRALTRAWEEVNGPCVVAWL